MARSPGPARGQLSSDLLCDFESLLFSSLGLNLSICEVGGAVFHGPHASESLKGGVF